MTIGEMIRSFLTKLEWFSTLFPRIPVPVQKNLDQYLKTRPRKIGKKDGKDAVEDIERVSERRHSRYELKITCKPQSIFKLALCL